MRCVVSGTFVWLPVLVLSIVDLVRNVSVRAWAVCAKLIFCFFRCCEVRNYWQVGRRKNSLGSRSCSVGSIILALSCDCVCMVSVSFRRWSEEDLAWHFRVDEWTGSLCGTGLKANVLF